MATLPPKPPTRPAGKPPMVKPLATRASPASPRTVKTFSVKPWAGSNEGEKIVLYGKSGIGKTTLAALAPSPVFIGLDDGGRKIADPRTGKPVLAVEGITGFQDIRDALHQKNLWPDGSTIIVDTLTKVESFAEPYIFEHYKRDGQTVTSMRKYGWDGPAHLLEVFRLLLSDLDEHVRNGRNVLLLCQLAQITVANAEGADYLEDGPKLQHNRQYSNRTEVCEWADHVLRLGYAEFNVVKDAKAKAGKVVSADATRAVYSGGAQHFIAKTRPVARNRETPYRIPAVVNFESEQDDSLWQFMFEGAVTE